MTSELFWRMGEIVFTQALTGILADNTDFAIGAYTFDVMLQRTKAGS